MTDIFENFKKVAGAELNDALDKASNPAKVSAKTLRDIEREMEAARTDMGSTMADQSMTVAEIAHIDNEIDVVVSYAKKAIAAGNEADALRFAEQVVVLKDKRACLDATLADSIETVNMLRENYDNLTSSLMNAQTRQRGIAGKTSLAKAKKRMTASGASKANAAGMFGIFRRMERKADKALAEAIAEERIELETNDPVADLKKKYETSREERIAIQLAELKKNA